MRYRTIIKALTVIVGLASIASARDVSNIKLDRDFIRSDGSSAAKAVGDTILLIGPTGSGAPVLGDFEAGMNGWTSIDVTQPTVHHWQVSNYNQAQPGNLAAWCGDLALAPCDVDDPVGGYRNSWHEILTARIAVNDPFSAATVRITATLQIDTEPAYDYVRLTAHPTLASNYLDLVSWDGTATLSVDETYSVALGEYVDGDSVILSFRFQSDGGWSDSDCKFPSAGACQIDDITVTVSQAGQPDLISFTDFQDGTYGDWEPTYPAGVGNYTKRWQGLRDADPCSENTSWQLAFIDDGEVVPGTGGSDCINWCDGPGGYIVNTTGGLAGPGSHIWNIAWSPVMAWPDDSMDGALLSYDAYAHENLDADSPGVFRIWDVWSIDTDNPDNWMDFHYFVYRTPPRYIRVQQPLGGFLFSGRDSVRVGLGVYELGWIWGWNGDDGYPAPYFDNVRLEVFETSGPRMKAWNADLAQDNFPEIDVIDLANPASLHVRFDMADNISPSEHMRNDPGDSIVVGIEAQRVGATLVGPPSMHYHIDANPVFDAYRTIATIGTVTGIPAVGASGYPSQWEWAFDLPDTGTLFPGDVLHYYIRAGDEVGGVVQYNTLPADLTGFSDFTSPLAYDSRFVVHALPSIRDDGAGGYTIPEILIWNDGLAAEKEAMWFGGQPFGDFENFDIYRTMDAKAGTGNGLGGRTNGGALAFYSDLFYTCGDMTDNTLMSTAYPGSDLAALTNWMNAGGRDLFLTGDNLASDLAVNQGAAGLAFLQQVMGLDFVAADLRPLTGNQSAPIVNPIHYDDGGLVFSVPSWIAYGACPGGLTFDAVTARPSASRQAEFIDPAGNLGAYNYDAATLNIGANNNRTISMPCDWSNIYTDPASKNAAPLAARAELMIDVRTFFGVPNSGLMTPVPQTENFAISASPNPFNPTIRLSYTIKSVGHLTLKIYNLRGQLVRTLIDRDVQTSGHVMWDGTDSRGASVASGVYFREARMGSDVRVGKIVLVK